MRNLKLLPSLTILLFSVLISSCSAIGGIFKAGMGFGVFIVVAILILIVVLVIRSNKN